MNEYLFRGKTKETNELVYGGIFVQDGRYFIIKSITYSCGAESWGAFEVDPETVGQWTGEVDKNKTPIYEGDIVKMRTYGPGYCNAVVYFKKGKFAVDGSNYGFKDLAPSTYEVLGNIHDGSDTSV